MSLCYIISLNSIHTVHTPGHEAADSALITPQTVEKKDADRSHSFSKDIHGGCLPPFPDTEALPQKICASHLLWALADRIWVVVAAAAASQVFLLSRIEYLWESQKEARAPTN